MGSRRRGRCRLIIITINGSLQKSTSSMWRCWWWEARNLSGVESQCRLIMFSYSAVLLLLLGQTVIQRESRGPSRVLFGRSSQATSLTKPHHRAPPSTSRPKSSPSSSAATSPPPLKVKMPELFMCVILILLFQSAYYTLRYLPWLVLTYLIRRKLCSYRVHGFFAGSIMHAAKNRFLDPWVSSPPRNIDRGAAYL